MQVLRTMNHLTLAVALVTVSLSAQVSKKANEGYQTKEDRERVARNLDNPDREERQKPRELIEAIEVNKGDVVADIGSGVGFMLPYFVEAVGSTGMVYAEDIQEDFLAKVKKKIKESGWKNVKTVLGAQKDVKLPSGSIDLAFILDAYHHFSYPRETLGTIRGALKPEGRLAVVDFYRDREHPSMSEERRKDHIRLDRDGFAEEIETAGFRLVKTFDHLPHQYVLIFTKK